MKNTMTLRLKTYAGIALGEAALVAVLPVYEHPLLSELTMLGVTIAGVWGWTRDEDDSNLNGPNQTDAP